MDKKLKKKWVKALRSGDYVQGEGVLCRTAPRGYAEYCCLGVLVEVMDGERAWQEQLCEFDGSTTGCLVPKCGDILEEDHAALPPAKQVRRSGMKWKTATNLADMNDCGKTFEEIADYIEKRL